MAHNSQDVVCISVQNTRTYDIHETVVSEHAAMVRRENNQRIVLDAYLLERIDKHPDCSIDFTDCSLPVDINACRYR